ncbi:MAG: DUF2231 domain-containing protein [Deltaproteobacteria bacterium]|nr:DUF2231 domain-containing protein [Deltaproteobacteria bacterium]
MESILPGVSSMANIHPLFVHYPIAFLSVFFLVDLIGTVFKREPFHRAASWFLFFGTLGAIGAVAAGLQAAATVEHAEEVHAILKTHARLGIAVLSLALVLSFWRVFGKRGLLLSGRLRLVHLFMAFVMVVAMTFGADLGGLMVYRHGVGGKAVKVSGGHEHGASGAGGHKALPGEDLHSRDNVHDHGHDTGHERPAPEGH